MDKETWERSGQMREQSRGSAQLAEYLPSRGGGKGIQLPLISSLMDPENSTEATTVGYSIPQTCQLTQHGVEPKKVGHSLALSHASVMTQGLSHNGGYKASCIGQMTGINTGQKVCRSSLGTPRSVLVPNCSGSWCRSAMMRHATKASE